jgi:hypothetical protein
MHRLSRTSRRAVETLLAPRIGIHIIPVSNKPRHELTSKRYHSTSVTWAIRRKQQREHVAARYPANTIIVDPQHRSCARIDVDPLLNYLTEDLYALRGVERV